jgi:lipid II:glycine glycyltransferase (peptidoglycan interpeptide bridge formation enzyme)
MHPMLATPSALADYGQLVRHGETVYIDLAVSETTLWSQIRARLRSYINGLKRAGFTAHFDDWSTYGEFVSVYGQTMARLQADQFYRFPEEYFRDLRTTLGDKLHLCSVFDAAGEFACGALLTENQGIVQYHLSGTTDKYLSCSPSKLMLHEVTLWAKREGYRVFHLGGGLGAQADSLLQFKAGFSPLRGEFVTCRLIYDNEKYNYLCGRTSSSILPDNYFPQYRIFQSTAP